MKILYFPRPLLSLTAFISFFIGHSQALNSQELNNSWLYNDPFQFQIYNFNKPTFTDAFAKDNLNSITYYSPTIFEKYNTEKQKEWASQEFLLSFLAANQNFGTNKRHCIYLYQGCKQKKK